MKNSVLYLAIVLVIALFTFTNTLTAQTNKSTELRAVCLHDYMFSSEKKEAMALLEDILDQYTTIGINYIACFYDLSNQPRDWDFLEVMIEKAHQRNIQVHPIIHPGYRVKLEGEIYPNLNMANPEARKHILRKISGIL